MRADIEAIRGVHCGDTLRLLMEKGFVKIVGRDDSLGRPVLYGTTKKFLQVFGLKSLKDLPDVGELRPPKG
jgi:segregation and condensation protein B